MPLDPLLDAEPLQTVIKAKFCRDLYDRNANLLPRSSVLAGAETTSLHWIRSLEGPLPYRSILVATTNSRG